jgi:HK97 family phage prohead protease
MSTKREVRSFTASQPFAVRTLANGSKQVSGYAIVFNSPASLGDFTEICSPQMLSRTLKENPDVLALRDHKQELLLGRTSAGTLDLRVDSKGLAFTVTLPQTAIGDDTAENVRLRNLSGCSFGFTTVDDSWAVDSDGNVVRTLLDVDLYEISITSFPAYQDTSVSARSRAAEMRSHITGITRSDDDLDEDDDDCDPELDGDCDEEGLDDEELNSSETCSCRCERCLTDRCERCIRSECSDPACYSRGCAMPGQDDNRSDDLRIRQLFNSRQKINSARASL